MYGLDIDPSDGPNGRFFISTGGLVWTMPVPAAGTINTAEPTLVCDCSEFLSPTDGGGFAPGQVYGLGANTAADEVYVIGATGDTVGTLLTCSLSLRKITHFLGSWNLATDGDRFIAAAAGGGGDTLAVKLGVGTPCVAGTHSKTCGEMLIRPIPVTYPAGVAQVWSNVMQSSGGQLGNCYSVGYGVSRFVPNEVKRVLPLGFQRAYLGPVRFDSSGRIFTMKKSAGSVLYEIQPRTNKPGLELQHVIPQEAQADTALDQDLFAAGSALDGKEYLYWMVRRGGGGSELVQYSIADKTVFGTGWSTIGPVCGSADTNTPGPFAVCQQLQQCQKLGVDGSKVNLNCVRQKMCDTSSHSYLLLMKLLVALHHMVQCAVQVCVWLPPSLILVVYLSKNE